MVVAPDGTVTARIASTASWLEGVLTDPDGAMLLVSRGGELLALEADGSERWHVDLHQSLARPAVALARGGVAVLASGGGLVLLR
jgi:hypothetical protein